MIGIPIMQVHERKLKIHHWIEFLSNWSRFNFDLKPVLSFSSLALHSEYFLSVWSTPNSGSSFTLSRIGRMSYLFILSTGLSVNEDNKMLQNMLTNNVKTIGYIESIMTSDKSTFLSIYFCYIFLFPRGIMSFLCLFM